ncbi:Mlp family lipoprotein [Borreliella kurtenbachii]|uniref:Mlp family lipoprotein n=1 Tax=Borreliella kurtenbachii TaxID=1196056 RepID=UPI003462ED78
MKINYILLILLILISCTVNNIDNKNTLTKKTSRYKRSLSEENIEIQKTLEELLIENLNTTQKEALSFLKESLESQTDFDKFLSHDEDKIKSALDHIKIELDKCNGNGGGKNTFKETLKGSFKGNSDNLDTFKDQAASTCGN